MLKILLISLCLFVSTVVSAEEFPIEKNELEQKSAVSILAEKIAKLNTFQADFVQSVKNEMGKEIDLSSGEFLIEKPNHFRWQVKQQFEQLIVADGDHIYTYDPELEQVTIQNQSKMLADSPLLFLTSDAAKLAQSFDISQVVIQDQLIDNKLTTEKQSDTAKNKQLFYLKPLTQGGIFESVHILFEGDNMTELFMVDSLGQQTSVTFSNAILNQKLASSLFSFVIPEGTDILDSREKNAP